jgi:hypothetical protein
MLTVGLIAICAGLLPAAGSFVPQASGVFGGVAHAACKWDGKPGPGGLRNTHDDWWWFKAEVVTNWCYDGTRVTSRHSVPGGHVPTAGVIAGFVYTESHWAYSGCHIHNGVVNHNCLTRREFNGFNLHDGGRFSVCIGTRIYGAGGHHRNIITSPSWDACGDGIQGFA